MRYVNGAEVRGGAVILPTDVERELVDIVEQLEKGASMLAEVSAELADVAPKYELAFARALVKSSGKSAEVRRAQALLACEDLYWQKAKLEASQRLIRDTQHDLRAQLEAVRSIGASVRSALWQGGSSGPPQQPPGRDTSGGFART